MNIAVIGGTGLYNLDGFKPIARVNPETPWGFPSAPILILEHGVGGDDGDRQEQGGQGTHDRSHTRSG